MAADKTSEQSFSDFVKETRERKKNEALAQQLLGRGRKSGSGAGSISNTRNSSQKPSLLSRTSGITKQRSSSAAPSIDGKWKHDLHAVNNPDGPPEKRLNRTVSTSQMDRNTRTFDKFRSVVQKNVQNNINNTQQATGFNIRGVAASGPYTIVASNFAPGTTAGDVQAVMGPHGGELLSCRLISANPTVVAELVFAERDGAENVISTFNGKKADGKVLYVYMKDASRAPIAHTRPAPRAALTSYDDMDVDSGHTGAVSADGGHGFNKSTGSFNAPRGPASRGGPPRGPRRRY